MALLTSSSPQPFEQITALTDTAEGTVVRVITRLDETCREVRDAARVIGDAELFKKMEEAQAKIKRDSESCFACILAYFDVLRSCIRSELVFLARSPVFTVVWQNQTAMITTIPRHRALDLLLSNVRMKAQVELYFLFATTGARFCEYNLSDRAAVLLGIQLAWVAASSRSNAHGLELVALDSLLGKLNLDARDAFILPQRGEDHIVDILLLGCCQQMRVL